MEEGKFTFLTNCTVWEIVQHFENFIPIIMIIWGCIKKKMLIIQQKSNKNLILTKTEKQIETSI